MKIVMIGSGNLATQLSLALKDAGREIVQVYSRTEAHAQELAEQLGCDCTTAIEAIRKDADVYVFSVKDDALSGLIGLITAVCSARPEALFLHTAGSVAMDIFKGYASHYGVLYPMQTFSKHRRVSFREIPCFVEASGEAELAVVRELAESVSEHVVDCDSEKRKKMHLAAVLCDKQSGRMVEISTDQPAAQVYTGNWLEGCPLSKSGKQYHDYDGVAIECQGMPDAPNHDNFQSPVLRPDEEYRRTIIFDFKVND